MKILLKTLIASSLLITITQLPIFAAPKPSCWEKTRSCFRCCVKEVVDHSDTILAIAQAVTMPFPEAQSILNSIRKIKDTSVMQALVIACGTDAIQPVTGELLAQLKTLNFPINADGTISANVKALINAAVQIREIPASNAEATRSRASVRFIVLNDEQLLDWYEVK